MISKFKPVVFFKPVLLFCAPLVGILFLSACAPEREKTYYPATDREGGWRKLEDPEAILAITGVDVAVIEDAFEIAKASTKNGGLLLVRNGWLVYENYFGLGHREALTNLASVGKSFTSLAAGIIMEEQPERFPDGVDQKIYHPDYLPEIAFPPTDPAKLEIKLGQLLAFTGGIRGNNPVYIHGEETSISPAGLDGWPGMVERQRSPYNPHYPYSLQFNVNTGGLNPNVPRDAFWKYGSGGHALYVVPSLELVIWKLGGRDSQYDSGNTGLVLHPEAPVTAPEREGWTAGLEIEDACTQILDTIVSSIRMNR